MHGGSYRVGTQVVLSGVLDVKAAKGAVSGKTSTEKLPTRCLHLCQYLRSCFGLPSQLNDTYLHDDIDHLIIMRVMLVMTVLTADVLAPWRLLLSACVYQCCAG